MTTAAALTASVKADQVLEVDPRRWIVLGVVLIGGFMAVVDASIPLGYWAGA